MRRDRGPLVWFAACTVVAVIAFAYYLVHRQQIADHRADILRRDLCGILSTIPNNVPPEIAKARRDFAQHPGDCQPVVKRSPTPSPRPTPEPARTSLVIVEPPTPVAVTPSPAASRTASPRPHPSRSPSHTPTPSPSPSCLHVNPIHRSVCIEETP